MNPRLQVEHPVTEMITGLDLVEWQLRVASGEPLPIAKQKNIHANGHAVEVRLYAEDPAAGFLPATGTIRHLALPEVGENLRIDSGIRQGDAVTPHYDPMIAKVIAWGEDRATAILRLRAALDALELEGCTTNLSFLRNLLADSVFEAGAHDTGYIGRALEALTHEPPLDEDALAAAALFQLLPEKPSSRRADPYSPWSRCYGWRPWGGARQFVRISYGGEVLEVAASFLRDGGMELAVPSGTVTLNITGREGNLFQLDLGDRVVGCSVIRTGSDVRVFLKGRCYHFSLPDLHYGAEQEESGDDRIISPLPGRVVEMKARVGQKVAEGTPLAVLEAMKMEHTLKAPRDGTIAEVFASAGDQVDEGTVLLIFEEEAG